MNLTWQRLSVHERLIGMLKSRKIAHKAISRSFNDSEANTGPRDRKGKLWGPDSPSRPNLAYGFVREWPGTFKQSCHLPFLLVLALWQPWHRLCKFSSPFEPPSLSGITWSTSVAGTVSPCFAHSLHNGSRLNCIPLNRCQRLP